MRKLDKFLIVFGVLALLLPSLFGNIATLADKLGAAGTAIMALAMVLPALFVIVLTVRLVRLAVPVHGARGWIVATVAAVAILAVPAYLVNSHLNQVAVEMADS